MSASGRRQSEYFDPDSSPINVRRPSQYDSSNLDRRRFSRRSSSASIASSISGTLDTASQNTSELSDLSHNAISSLLSHPIVRTGLVLQSALSIPAGHRAPSVRDIPPVSLTPIPHVEPSSFKHYLSTIGPLYDTYQRSKSPPAEEPSTPRAIRTPQHLDYFSSRRDSTASIPSTPRRESTLSPPITPSTPRRPSSAQGTPRRDPYAPTPLSTIPNVYFGENFHLENPRTFDVVSEHSDVIPPDPSEVKSEARGANGAAKAPVRPNRRALHTNAILQEKLSWYMDTVEVHLIQSIATASSSFFAALGSLKDLESEAADSIQKIKALREALKQLDKEMALGGLEVVKMRRRRQNLKRLGDAVKQLCDVMEEATKCEDLVEQGSLEDANARVDNLEDMIVGKSTAQRKPGDSPRIDLRRLKALGGLSEGTTQLRQHIGRGYEAKFVEALLSDLRQHVEHVPPTDTMQRWANASLRARGDHKRAKSVAAPAYMRTNESLRPELLAALAGLNKAGGASHAAVAYREAVMREIKSIIRRYLPSSNDEDNESTTSMSTRGGQGRRMSQQEKSVVLARNLRALDPESFEELLVKVYTSVGEALRRVGNQVKVVLDVTSNVEAPKDAESKSQDGRSTRLDQIRDEVTQVLDMSSLLGQAVDTIQTQVTKVLRVRSDQNARLPLQQFLRYFILNRLFLDECEAVSSRGGEVLKEVVNSQLKDFLTITTDRAREQIFHTLNSDQWEARDFTREQQAILDRILASMDRTPQLWTSYTSLWESDLSQHTATATNGEATAESPAKTRSAKIDEQHYILVQSTISALHSIENFLTLIAAIPSVTSDCSYKLLDYLKGFNSRCTQLILGAGATKSAGLKNITTKHLALASQTCSFLIALFPYMREFVRRQAGSSASTILQEFDKAKRSFQEHQFSIHEKLVDIMSQRSNLHVAAMKKIDWDVSVPRDTVDQWAETLAKETGTLHRVLSRHVAEGDLQMIMVPIFANYSSEWTKAFEDAGVKTEGGKQRMLNDLNHLNARFSRIESSGEFVQNLIDLVNKKQVAPTPRPSVEKPAPPPPPPPAETKPTLPPSSTEVKPAPPPTQSKSAESKPANPIPAATPPPPPKPPESESTEPNPIQAEPVKSKPVEAKPAEESVVTPGGNKPSRDGTTEPTDQPQQGQETDRPIATDTEAVTKDPEVNEGPAVVPTANGTNTTTGQNAT